MSEWGVVVFRSSHLAVRAEKVVAKLGIECKLIPVPRHLSSDCGVALRFHLPDFDRVQSALTNAHVEFEFITDEN